MRFAACLVIAFACVLLVSIGCSSSDDVINTPPGADGACSNPPGVNNRFVDCGNGTVTDTQTHLIWLKRANCFPSANWTAAMDFAAGLKNGDCGLTDHSSAGDWRLPTLECSLYAQCALSAATGEFTSIFGSACSSAPYVLNTAGTGCWTEGNPFYGVVPYTYWSSSNWVDSPTTVAWVVGLNNGRVDSLNKPSAQHVWPVRGGP